MADKNNSRDPQNPYAATTGNDLGLELTELVINWYRGHRNVLTAAQQSAFITAVTSILNGTFKV